MKQIAVPFLLAIGVLFSISSCKKKGTDNGGGGNGSANDIDVTVPYTKSAVLPAIDSPFNLVSLPIEKADTFATKVDEMLNLYAGGISKSKIKTLTAKTMNVIVDGGTGQTFDFVDDSVKVYVDSFGGTNPILVAYKYGIPKGATSIDFNVVNTDIKNLFYAPFMQVTMKFNTVPHEKVLAGSNFVTNFSFRIIASGN
jgi:hypothetical protein